MPISANIAEKTPAPDRGRAIERGCVRWVCTRGMALLLSATAPALAADETRGPSGMAATLYEVRFEQMHDAHTRAHFRFHLPDLAGHDYTDVADDFAWLCDHVALAELDRSGAAPATLIISLADRAVPFGESDPAAVQFFEIFRRAGTRCEWEILE